MLSGRRHDALLSPTRSALFVVDVQETFRSYVDGFDAMAGQIRLIAAGAARLGIPIACSEQYPEGLGTTVPELELPAGTPSFGKVEFAASDTAAWDDLPADVRSADQFVLVGIEAHVCIRHTALSLLAAGRDVHVVVDAVGSRTQLHRDTALAALAQEGARMTTVEQVLFDWLRKAGTPEFKDIQALLRELEPGTSTR